MMVDWNAFTPWPALSGGILIGIAAALFALLNGRIAGISGVVGGLLRPTPGDIAWRLAFILGLMGTPLIFQFVTTVAPPQIDADSKSLVISGLLVGIGTRYGGGCTSGHGVCGLARARLRSLVATTVFILGGALTVFIARHLIDF